MQKKVIWESYLLTDGSKSHFMAAPSSSAPVVELAPKDIAEPQELVAKIKERRPNGELMNLDRMLLHSPPFAEGWNSICGNVRNKMDALGEKRILELAILVIGLQNGAIYEVVHHTLPFLDASYNQGKDPAVTLDEITYLTNDFRYDEAQGGLMGTDLFDTEERLVIDIAIGISKCSPASIRPTIERLKIWKAGRDDQASASAAVVELVGAISAYNMVSRFLIFTEGIVPESGADKAKEMIQNTINVWFSSCQ